MIPRMFAPYTPRAPGEPRSPPPLQLAIRPAVHLDLNSIAQISAQRNGGSLDRFLESVRQQFEADTKQENLTAVAECDGVIAGYGRARKVDAIADERYSVPGGWYLLGVVVTPEMRRRSIATALTRFRLDWIGQRVSEAFYFANSLNGASIDLHEKLGFVEVQRPFAFPGTSFSGGGVGVLFRASLSQGSPATSSCA
jgi:ribosomal protein S18 acetylase RimI-like enzyme